MAGRMSKVFRSSQKDFDDISGDFDRRLLSNDHVLANFGLSGGALASAYDQVQSLLAVATLKGIYVLGQHGVEVFFKTKAAIQIAHVVINGSHIVAVDTKNMLYTWSIEDKSEDPVATQALRGVVNTVYAEPSVSWLFIGCNDGSVVVWDIEGEQINPTFKIKNLYQARQEDWRLMGESYALPRYHISPVIQLSIHPTDLGMLLITYPDGACLYSLKDGKSKTFYECILPQDGRLPERKPALTCSTFSPDGQYVLLGTADGTLAFFNVSDGEVPIQVRNLELSDINLPGANANGMDVGSYDPIISIQWCCRTEPNDTYILVAGGLTNDIKGVSLLEYGKPPTKASDLQDFFATPNRHKIFPTSRDQIVSLLPIGTGSPYHINDNPRAVMLINVAGNFSFLRLTDGQNMPVEALAPGLSFRDPVVTSFVTAKLPQILMSSLLSRTKKLGNDTALLLGGANRTMRLPKDTPGSILCTVHDGSLLRLYDISRGCIVDPALAEVDLTLTMPNTFAQTVAMSNSTGEIAVSSESGLVVLYKCTPYSTVDTVAKAFVDLSIVEPMPTLVKEAQNMLFKFGTQDHSDIINPHCVISARHGEVTALCVSDVGFVAIGYESGFFILIDLRGPAIFHAGTCDKLEVKKRDSIFKKPSTPKMNSTGIEYVTAASFFAMTVEARMSLVIVMGTSRGRTISFELLREENGVYMALLSKIESTSSGVPIKKLLGCNQFGENIAASGIHLNAINSDAEVPDCVLAVTESECISYAGLAGKIASTSYRSSGIALSAQLVTIPNTDSVVLVVLLQNSVEIFSIPGLRPLGTVPLRQTNDGASPAQLTSMGDMITMDDKYSLSLHNLFSQGTKASDLPRSELYDAMKQPLIPRPTISNWAWVTGTQYVTSLMLDQIISGGSRALSKRAMERLAASEQQQALLERQTAARDKVTSRNILQSAQNAGGYDRSTGRNVYSDMARGGQERGEKMAQVNDMFENISKASGEWLSEVDKITSNAKKSAGKAALRSFLGF